MTQGVGPVDGAKLIIDYIASQPLVTSRGWDVAGESPPNVTPEKFIRVTVVDGDSSSGLLFRNTIQLRVWDSSPYLAGRIASMLIAHLRRDLGVRVLALPVALPDPVDSGKTFQQFTILLPKVGVEPE